MLRYSKISVCIASNVFTWRKNSETSYVTFFCVLFITNFENCDSITNLKFKTCDVARF